MQSLSIHIPCDGCERGKQDGSSQYSSSKGGKGLQKGPSTREEEVVIIIYPVHIQHTYKERKKIKPIIFLCWKKKKWEEGERVEEFKKSFPKKWICVVCAVWIHFFGDEGGGKNLLARGFLTLWDSFSPYSHDPFELSPQKTDRPLYVCVCVTLIHRCITTTLVAKITIIIFKKRIHFMAGVLDIYGPTTCVNSATTWSRNYIFQEK